jgi:hypothetical protein
MAQVFDVLANLTFNPGNTDSILGAVGGKLVDIQKSATIPISFDAKNRSWS